MAANTNWRHVIVFLAFHPSSLPSVIVAALLVSPPNTSDKAFRIRSVGSQCFSLSLNLHSISSLRSATEWEQICPDCFTSLLSLTQLITYRGGILIYSKSQTQKKQNPSTQQLLRSSTVTSMVTAPLNFLIACLPPPSRLSHPGLAAQNFLLILTLILSILY